MNMNVTAPRRTDLAPTKQASAEPAKTAAPSTENKLHDHLNQQMVLYSPKKLSSQAHSFAEKHSCFSPGAKAEMGAFLTSMLQHHGLLPHHYTPGQAYQQQAHQQHPYQQHPHQQHPPAHPQAPAHGHFASGPPLSAHSQKLEAQANQQMRELEHQTRIAEKVKMAQVLFKMRKEALDFMLQNIG